jgi:hypothetical protein
MGYLLQIRNERRRPYELYQLSIAQLSFRGMISLRWNVFFDTTRHMIEFDVLTHNSPVGDKGYKYRVFLSEEGYQKALSAQKHGDIRIFKHARVIEGHILYDKRKHQMSR